MKPWQVPVDIPFAHKDLAKDIPGAEWDGERKKWLVPSDAVSSLLKTCQKRGVRCIPIQSQKTQNYAFAVSKLQGYEWQQRGAAQLLHQKRWPINDEGGLGKSRTVIEAMKQAKFERALIICPALVRGVWKDELAKWWPEHPTLGLVNAGLGRKQLTKKHRAALEAAQEAKIIVSSYALLEELELDFDLVVVDESHRVKNPNAKQSKAVSDIVCGATYVWELTGTPVANDPQDAWHQFELLWPGRFGKGKGGIPRKFRERYCLMEHNGYGERWFGLNPLHAEEFRERVAQLSSRTTKSEVAHLLPPFLVQMVKVEPKGAVLSSRLAFEDFKALQTELDAAVETKLALLPEWLEDTADAAHRCILTYHRETAKAIANRYADKHNVYEITGAMLPEERNEALKAAKAQPSSLIVATMDSIGIGIDLTFCTQAVMVELTYKPSVMIQTLWRFSRLSSKEPSAVKILCVERTADEVVASKLLAKIEAINKSVKPGEGEQKLQAALGQNDGDWLADLNSALEVA